MFDHYSSESKQHLSPIFFHYFSINSSISHTLPPLSTVIPLFSTTYHRYLVIGHYWTIVKCGLKYWQLGESARRNKVETNRKCIGIGFRMWRVVVECVGLFLNVANSGGMFRMWRIVVERVRICWNVLKCFRMWRIVMEPGWKCWNVPEYSGTSRIVVKHGGKWWNMLEWGGIEPECGGKLGNVSEGSRKL